MFIFNKIIKNLTRKSNYSNNANPELKNSNGKSLQKEAFLILTVVLWRKIILAI